MSVSEHFSWAWRAAGKKKGLRGCPLWALVLPSQPLPIHFLPDPWCTEGLIPRQKIQWDQILTFSSFNVPPIRADRNKRLVRMEKRDTCKRVEWGRVSVCLCEHVCACKHMCMGVHVSMCGMCTFDHMLWCMCVHACKCVDVNVWASVWICEYVEGVYANKCSVCTCEQAWMWCVHVNVCVSIWGRDYVCAMSI